MASVEGRTYPFNAEEMKEHTADHCTLTFHLKGLRSKHKVDASIFGRALSVRAKMDGKVYQTQLELAGEFGNVEQGSLKPELEDNQMHVTFKKKTNFSMST